MTFEFHNFYFEDEKIRAGSKQVSGVRNKLNLSENLF